MASDPAFSPRPAESPRLESIGEGIWVADGAPVSFLRIPYPTRMVLVRLPGAELWVWSPLALAPGLAEEVDRLGAVRHVVSPNKLHHLFLGEWAQRWPGARLHAPPGLARRRRDLRFDADLDETVDPAWRGVIDQVVVRGSFALEEVWFFHRPSRTAIVGDLVQKFEPSSLRRWQRWVMRLDGLVGPDGAAPREVRASFLRRGPARSAVREALAWDPEKLVIAHGTWARERGGEVLRRSMAWLGAADRGIGVW